jgi:hypothetical protein
MRFSALLIVASIGTAIILVQLGLMWRSFNRRTDRIIATMDRIIATMDRIIATMDRQIALMK